MLFMNFLIFMTSEDFSHDFLAEILIYRIFISAITFDADSQPVGINSQIAAIYL